MKKTIVATILGLAAAVSSFAQGSIIFDNYTQGTYNQVVWGAGVPGKVAGTAVQDPISLQLYFGEGVLTELGQLTAGVSGAVNPGFTFVGAAGAGGWFSGATQVLNSWAAGDVFTFAVVVTSAGYQNTPILWQESANIRPTNVAQTGFANFPGVTVVPIPEPSTFALAGLGSAALLIFRRRK